MNYKILHDLGRPLCFIGDTWHNRTQAHYWHNQRPCETVTLEHCLQQSQQWWDERQFMCAVTNVAFKKKVAELTTRFIPSWFSVINETSCTGYDVIVGRNTWVNCFNTIYDSNIIGDHVTISNYVQLSHHVQIGDMCHISPYSYLCFADIGRGVCMAMRCAVPGKPGNRISVCDWANVLMDSRITRSITVPGTWYGNRKLNNQSSLDVKIL